MGYNAFKDDERYNPRIGINGRVGEDDFSIDGRSWNYRDPQNKDSNEHYQSQKRGDMGSAEDDWSKNAKTYANPLYDYSYGQVRDAAKQLNIGNVKNKDEVDQLLTQLRSSGKSKAENFKDDFIDKKITAPRENSNTEVEIPTNNATAGDNSIASSISQRSGIDVKGNSNNVDQNNSIDQEQAGSFLDKYKLSLNSGKGLNLN